jgi:hypothetical protein
MGLQPGGGRGLVASCRDALHEEAVTAFRRRMADVVARMESARDPEAFCTVERELVGAGAAAGGRDATRSAGSRCARSAAAAQSSGRSGSHGGGDDVVCDGASACGSESSRNPRHTGHRGSPGARPAGISRRCTPALRLLVARTVRGEIGDLGARPDGERRSRRQPQRQHPDYWSRNGDRMRYASFRAQGVLRLIRSRGRVDLGS